MNIPPSFFLRAFTAEPDEWHSHRVWNVPAISWGQQSKLCPLPASCPPLWILGGQDSDKASSRVQTLFRVARLLVCYQSFSINKCRAQHQLLSQPDPAQAPGAMRHSLTQECFLQLVVLVSQERYPTGIRQVSSTTED